MVLEALVAQECGLCTPSSHDGSQEGKSRGGGLNLLLGSAHSSNINPCQRQQHLSDYWLRSHFPTLLHWGLNLQHIKSQPDTGSSWNKTVEKLLKPGPVYRLKVGEPIRGKAGVQNDGRSNRRRNKGKRDQRHRWVSWQSTEGHGSPSETMGKEKKISKYGCFTSPLMLRIKISKLKIMSPENSDSFIFTTAVSDEGFQRAVVLVRVSLLCVYETPWPQQLL